MTHDFLWIMLASDVVHGRASEFSKIINYDQRSIIVLASRAHHLQLTLTRDFILNATSLTNYEAIA